MALEHQGAQPSCYKAGRSRVGLESVTRGTCHGTAWGLVCGEGPTGDLGTEALWAGGSTRQLCG